MQKIIKVILIFFILFSITIQVYAYNKSDYAFTMGCVESNGVDTSIISEKANYWYGTAGGGNKICYGLTTPDFNMLKNGSFVNGPRLIESGVVFLCGHANSEEIWWEDSSDNYCFVRTGSNSSNDVGLNNVNYTGTSLVTFAGCETAMGPAENLTTKAVDRGSTAALGWRVKIHFQSLKN